MLQNGIRALFCDIGGVLGTNGWDGSVRSTICRHFQIDEAEIASRHRLMFDSYERGFLSFEDYLKRVFFGEPRSFSLEQVREFAYAQSVAWPENISFFENVKKQNRLKLGLISNEGEGITEHRVGKFKLRELADFMLISHFVHMRKPDRAIWQLALDLVQVEPQEAVYVDDRAMFADFAGSMGFHSIQHVSLTSTAEKLRKFGLQA